jgi:hypothetical protein
MYLEHALDEIRNPVLEEASSRIQAALETPIEPQARVGNLDDKQRDRVGTILPRIEWRSI